MEKANNLINALTEYLVEQEERYQGLSDRIGALEPSEPIEPPVEPIEPPVEPIEPTVTIINNGRLNPGASGVFEAVIEGVTDDEIEKVEFFIDGKLENTERHVPYQSWPTIPKNDFEVSAKFYLNNGNASISGSKIFQVDSSGSSGSGGSGGSSGTPAGISLYDTFVSESDGTYYIMNADNETEGILQDNDVAALFNTGDTHYGKPENRARIVTIPELGRKGFIVEINNESGGFGDRFATQKTNSGSSTFYPDARAVASYTELYFRSATAQNAAYPDREKFEMRNHFKSSSFQPTVGPPSPGQNSETNQPRTTQPGQAEAVRFSFYGPQSQSSPENKGDMGKAYFGQNTWWDAADLTKIQNDDLDTEFIMGAAFYTQQANQTYNYEVMGYPGKPDQDGNPTTSRLLLPTDKLIKSWSLWGANTLDGNNDGNADGTYYWWLQIDGINGGEPWPALIVENHMWTTGAKLRIGRAGLGAYFNPGDQPSIPNGFFVLRDDVYYKSYV